MRRLVFLNDSSFCDTSFHGIITVAIRLNDLNQGINCTVLNRCWQFIFKDSNKPPEKEKERKNYYG